LRPRAPALRHVHDAFEACLFSGLSEIGCRLQNSGADRITEVCAANFSHRRAHVVEFQKVADTTSAPIFSSRFERIFAMGQRPHRVSSLQQLLDV